MSGAAYDDSALIAPVVRMRRAGDKTTEIAIRLRIGRERVERILAEHSNTRRSDPQAKAVMLGSRALIDAIRKHHPEKCGGIA